MRRLLLLLAAGAMLLALGIPANADAGGTVTGTVTMENATPCLEIPTPTVDLGAGTFSRAGAPAGKNGQATLVSCSSVQESVVAHGSNATGPSPIAWNLVTPANPTSPNPCDEGADKYYETVRCLSCGGGANLPLTLNDRLVGLIGSAARTDWVVGMYAACLGSSGAGAVMSMDWVFTATIP